MNELNESIQNGLTHLLQFAVDLDIPFDREIKTKFDVVYLQCALQWGIFIITLAFSYINNFARSVMGGVR